MWQATITNVEKVQAGDRVTVITTAQYTNGTETRVLTHSALTEEQLKSTVRNNINNLNLADSLKAKEEELKTAFDVSLPEPTAEEVAKKAFKVDLLRWRSLKKAIADGFLPADDTEFVALGEKLNASFTKDYLDIM